MEDSFDGTEHPHAYPRLYELMSTLQVRGLTTDLRARTLTVSRPDDPTRATRVITCRPRPTDGDRLWFFDEATGDPIEQAGHIADAAVIVAGSLAPAP
ncbi:hypothetical protein AGRA3207_001855 [Actinomadura graeca]|uniref:Uncharacterized protein n=1 Tax=Actinomadura graeca TaxID=2750812 RepID=A0ABX8QUC2_9ACTN|nr:hypothetical protein [Actinomadura graeca]QXJ21042.1 hypothetical protein AGRA3207_001855 [Actinomadura graeca]